MICDPSQCHLTPSRIPLQQGQSGNQIHYKSFPTIDISLTAFSSSATAHWSGSSLCGWKQSPIKIPTCHCQLLLASGQSKLWSVSGQFSGQLLTMEYWSALTFYLSLSLSVSKPAMSHGPPIPDPLSVKVHVVQSKHWPKGNPKKLGLLLYCKHTSTRILTTFGIFASPLQYHHRGSWVV